jgi:type I restriction enzyme S subunit
MNDDLPEGWQEILLPDVASRDRFAIVDGPFGSDLKLTDYVSDGTVPVLTTKNLTGLYDPAAVRFISNAKYEQLKRSRVVGGDILIAKIGSIGKCSIYPKGAPTAIIPANLCKITVNRKVISGRFLYWQFRTEEFQKKLKEITSATAQPAFSVKRLKTLSVKLPPLPEQERIVEKLEHLLGKVDACQSHLTRIPIILKRFRLSALAAACSGRLTEDWRSEASDADSLAKEEGGPLAKGVEETTETPSSWRWMPLKALSDPARSICYGVIKLGSEYPGGIPCLRTSDVKALYIDTADVKRISPDISNDYARTLLQGGEVLVNVRGTLGGVAVVPQKLKGWNISREVAVVPVSGALEHFVAYWIASLHSQNWLSGVAKGVAYTGINIEDLKQLPMAMPSPLEQQEIVRRVKNLFSLADEIEARFERTQEIVRKLTPSVLAKAFRGELVPTEAELAPTR